MTRAYDGFQATPIRLYHGSDVAIEHPDVARNTGFADLGTGFYLTDDHEAARRRAKSRARWTGAPTGVVSVFELDTAGLPWVLWGSEAPEPSADLHEPFGLRFDATPAGIAAWANYIAACRKGTTTAPGVGEPAVVRAWIATEELEMVYAGFATAEELAELVDPSELIVQYCLRDQDVLDRTLTFMEEEHISCQKW